MLHVKKNDKIDALNQQNNYIKNKNMNKHNILKINIDKFLSINIKKLNITLQIFRNITKQYFIIKTNSTH